MRANFRTHGVGCPIFLKDGKTLYDIKKHTSELIRLRGDVVKFVAENWRRAWPLSFLMGGSFYVHTGPKLLWNDLRIMTVTVYVREEEHVDQVKRVLETFSEEEHFDVTVECPGRSRFDFYCP